MNIRILSIFLMLMLPYHSFSHTKKRKIRLPKETVLSVPDSIHKNLIDTLAPLDTVEIKDSILRLRTILTKEYEQRDKSKIDTTKSKQILSVSWFDSYFQKVTNISRGEYISIAVLTKGYNVGDTVKITIHATDDKPLIGVQNCMDVTFIGIVNFENLAFLQKVFTVEGEDEQMVICPQWKDRYICGKQELPSKNN